MKLSVLPYRVVLLAKCREQINHPTKKGAAHKCAEAVCGTRSSAMPGCGQTYLVKGAPAAVENQVLFPTLSALWKDPPVYQDVEEYPTH